MLRCSGGTDEQFRFDSGRLAKVFLPASVQHPKQLGPPFPHDLPVGGPDFSAVVRVLSDPEFRLSVGASLSEFGRGLRLAGGDGLPEFGPKFNPELSLQFSFELGLEHA